MKPQTWLSESLESVTSLIKDGTHGTHEDVAEGIPLLSAKDVRNGSLIIENSCRKISDSEYKLIHRNYEIVQNDILLTIVGSIGRCYLLSGSEPKFTVQRSVAIVRPNQIEAEYLYHYFQSKDFQKSLKDFTNASAQGGVYLTSLGQCQISFPPSKAEQKQIATILSTIDQAIAQTEAIIAKQQRIKTGLMQDLLTKGIDAAGNVRSEATHEFKDSAIGRIPVEWEVDTIASVLTQSPKNGYSPPEADNWNGSYILGLGCLTLDGFKPRQFKYAPVEDRLCKSALLHDGDFLISRSNTRSLVGLVGRFKDMGEPCIYPDLMMKLCFSNQVLADYMEKVFMSLYMRKQIENLASGTSESMVKINAAGIKKFLFRKPPIYEQLKIVEFLNLSTEKISQMTQNLSKLHSLKTGLMQDLLTGKVRVTALLPDPETPSP
jgi:type I restriction enzyme, S subunit